MATVAPPPDVEADTESKWAWIAEKASEIIKQAEVRGPVGELVSELSNYLKGPEESDSAPVPLCKLIEEHPKLHRIVIDGYLRLGETANLIAMAKRGKSWKVMGLAFAVAEGCKWLGRVCRQGRVLLIDGELHPATIAHRMKVVAEAVEAKPDVPIDVLSLRGENCDLPALAARLESIKPCTYDLIILDALYRFLPAGTSENDNAAMMAVYNTIDQIAKQLQAAVVIVHHTSKGSQADKAVTDVGSGAGSISRAADTHMTIRDHEEPGYQILEAVTRSFPAPDPISIYFKHPLWFVSDLEPKANTGRPNRQAEKDRETRDTLLKTLKAMSGKPATTTVLKAKTGFGVERIRRGVAMLTQSGLARQARRKNKRSGKAAEVVILTPDGLADGLKHGLKGNPDHETVDHDGTRVLI